MKTKYTNFGNSYHHIIFCDKLNENYNQINKKDKSFLENYIFAYLNDDFDFTKETLLFRKQFSKVAYSLSLFLDDENGTQKRKFSTSFEKLYNLALIGSNLEDNFEISKEDEEGHYFRELILKNHLLYDAGNFASSLYFRNKNIKWAKLSLKHYDDVLNYANDPQYSFFVACDAIFLANKASKNLYSEDFLESNYFYRELIKFSEDANSLYSVINNNSKSRKRIEEIRKIKGIATKRFKRLNGYN